MQACVHSQESMPGCACSIAQGWVEIVNQRLCSLDLSLGSSAAETCAVEVSFENALSSFTTAALRASMLILASGIHTQMRMHVCQSISPAAQVIMHMDERV